MRRFLIAITRNPVSLMGVALTTASAFLILNLLFLEWLGVTGNPYVGILAYLLLPGIFMLGLGLIPVGILWERRRIRRAEERGEPIPGLPVIDLNIRHTRRMVMTLLMLTVINVVILSTATYKGVEVMDSTEFCGLACHSVMAPEYTAYEGSPHARVHCVECHIGPGADWFVKSKLSGVWQVVSVTFDLYQRPIPAPIEHLRPARETCEQCHWPTKFVGDRLRVNTHYASDEANSEMKTILLLKVGGIQGRKSQGIHWHVDPNIEIRYRSDKKRETIYDVELISPDGTVRTYRPPEVGEDAEIGDWRVMDCVDCHNRPTHIYKLPEQAIDEALLEGRIDRSLPYVRREGLKAITQAYPSHEAARRAITDALTAFYAKDYPEVYRAQGEAVAAAVDTLARIYARNVFPNMKVTWGTYADHIGHVNFPGCFRCHNDEHITVSGEVISQDCSSCHTLLAMEETDPEILRMLNP